MLKKCDAIHILAPPLSLYCDRTVVAEQRQIMPKARASTVDNGMDTPLSQSNVTLRLSEIQKRCRELMDESEDTLDLRLEEPAPIDDGGDIYNR